MKIRFEDGSAVKYVNIDDMARKTTIVILYIASIVIFHKNEHLAYTLALSTMIYTINGYYRLKGEIKKFMEIVKATKSNCAKDFEEFIEKKIKEQNTNEH